MKRLETTLCLMLKSKGPTWTKLYYTCVKSQSTSYREGSRTHLPKRARIGVKIEGSDALFSSPLRPEFRTGMKVKKYAKTRNLNNQNPNPALKTKMERFPLCSTCALEQILRWHRWLFAITMNKQSNQNHIIIILF